MSWSNFRATCLDVFLLSLTYTSPDEPDTMSFYAAVIAKCYMHDLLERSFYPFVSKEGPSLYVAKIKK